MGEEKAEIRDRPKMAYSYATHKQLPEFVIVKRVFLAVSGKG